MKLIHLSDLHLGKRVNEISMLEDQRHILAKILEIIDREQPDAVLLAGDIYDKSVPPAEAVSLLDDFLWSLAQRQTRVLMIPGNHDSAERLSFAGRLLTGSGVHLAGPYEGQADTVLLSDRHGEVCFYLLPFLKPAHVRRFFPENPPESYTDALDAVIRRMAVDTSRRNVLVTHQFVTGAGRCESEEISVGGADNVDAAVFEPFDYVALGHIHGPQNIVPGKIRYCGTPLKYSFSEAGHHKSVTVVELEEKGNVTVRTVPLVPLRDMRELRGSYRELTALEFYRDTPREDYLHITLTDEEDVPEAIGRLRVIYPNLMRLDYDNTRTRTTRQLENAPDLHQKSPLTLFEELYQLQNNQPLSPAQQEYMQALMEEIWGDCL